MDITKCTKIIEKIAENHVIVKHVLYDSKGKEVVIETEEYGQDRIDKELEAAQVEKKVWDEMTTAKINDAKVIAESKISKITELQTKMDSKSVVGELKG
ncbi:MAG: hypothetical protein ACTSU7_00320 [Candidatus Heimdallarchaeaceae archaeon]